MANMVRTQIMEMLADDPIFESTGIKVTKSIWLPMPPYYISFYLDIVTVEQAISPFRYIDKFIGPIIFYDNKTDFQLAREIDFIKNNMRCN